MYDLSRDYLAKLIGASGVKVGSAKQQAMVTIIELLDKNSLDGLLESIKADYMQMQSDKAESDLLRERITKMSVEAAQMQRKLRSLYDELARVSEEKQTVEKELSGMKREALIAGCCHEEESRVRAYKAALEIGMEAAGYPTYGTLLEQVIRSASSVAANWRGVKETEVAKP